MEGKEEGAKGSICKHCNLCSRRSLTRPRWEMESKWMAALGGKKEGKIVMCRVFMFWIFPESESFSNF